MSQAPRIGTHAVFAALIVSLAGCSGSGSGTSSASQSGGGVAKSTLARSTTPNASASDIAAVAQGETAFSFDLYRATNPGGDQNLFFAPYSVSIALSMTYAGAAGQTASEMASTLRYTIPEASLAPAFDAIDLALASRGTNLQGTNGQPFRLEVENALWAQQGFTFLQGYLDTLALNYGAGVRLEDFKSAPDTAVADINAWVNAATLGMIPTLFSSGAFSQATRLVLTNAVYFDAAWATPFDPNLTAPGNFNLASGTPVTAQFMNETLVAPYVQRAGATAIELPYDGSQVAMVIVVPDAGTFATYEAALDATVFDDIVSNLASTNVNLLLPRFDLNSSLDLATPLASLGMPSAFGATADFSGMDGATDLHIAKIVHKATAIVNEQGTQAAAATGIVITTTGIIATPPVPMKVDRPFIFAIIDLPTNTILFVGRVANPS